jgi:hypothetical protein
VRSAGGGWGLLLVGKQIVASADSQTHRHARTHTYARHALQVGDLGDKPDQLIQDVITN